MRRQNQKASPDAPRSLQPRAIPNPIPPHNPALGVLQLDTIQNLLPQQLHRGIAHRPRKQPRQDLVALRDAALRVVPPRRVRQHQHAEEGQQAEEGLQRDGEAPRDLRVPQPRKAEVDPVCERDAPDQVDALDGYFGAALGFVDGCFAHVGWDGG